MPATSQVERPLVPLRVAFQSSSAPQDLRLIVRAPKPLRWMSDDDLGLDSGAIGGAEFAPWETSYERRIWGEKTSEGGTGYLYAGRVAGMSHRFVPHLVGRVLLSADPDEVIESLEVAGSDPVTDARTSITTDDVAPILADLESYPGVWPDLGFEVVHVPSKKHEFGLRIEPAEPLDRRGKDADALRMAFGSSFRGLVESFANDRGKPVNMTVQRKKMAPLIIDERVAYHAFPYEVRHAHAPCVAMALNILAKLHRTRAAIKRVVVTAREMPRG